MLPMRGFMAQIRLAFLPKCAARTPPELCQRSALGETPSGLRLQDKEGEFRRGESREAPAGGGDDTDTVRPFFAKATQGRLLDCQAVGQFDLASVLSVKSLVSAV